MTGADVVSMVGNWTHGMSTLPNISLSDAAINLGNFSNENDTLLHVGQGLNVTEVSQFADDIKLIFGTDADVYIMFNTTCGCGELG